MPWDIASGGCYRNSGWNNGWNGGGFDFGSLVGGNSWGNNFNTFGSGFTNFGGSNSFSGSSYNCGFTPDYTFANYDPWIYQPPRPRFQETFFGGVVQQGLGTALGLMLDRGVQKIGQRLFNRTSNPNDQLAPTTGNTASPYTQIVDPLAAYYNSPWYQNARV